MEGKIKEYNARFDDNRSLLRKIMEFPYVLRSTLRYMRNPMFWILFLKNWYFFKAILFIIIYFIIPTDFIPERLFGVVGLIDDLLMLFTFVLIAMAFFAPVFIRAHVN